MELLYEHWTLLVARELLKGSMHFNDLRRGVPKGSVTVHGTADACRAVPH
jgi:DNA-binding HxlR family transcriptional regulator